MNPSLLLLLLQLCCFMETHTSAKPHNGTKLQTKDDKAPKKSWPGSRFANDKNRNSQITFLFKRQKWLSGESFLKRVRKITKRPTTSTHCKIFCRSGYHLQILPNGAVKGTVDQGSKYGECRLDFYLYMFHIRKDVYMGGVLPSALDFQSGDWRVRRRVGGSAGRILKPRFPKVPKPFRACKPSIGYPCLENKSLYKHETLNERKLCSLSWIFRNSEIQFR